MVASARILLLLTRLKGLIRSWKVGQVPAHPLALLDFPVRRLFRLYCCSAEWGQHSLGFLVRSFGLTQVAFAGDRQDGPTSAVSSTAPLQALPLYSPGFSEPASQGGNPRVWRLWGYPAQFVQRQWGTIWGRVNPATAASASLATAQDGGFVNANVYDPADADAAATSDYTPYSELAMAGTLTSSELETAPQCPHRGQGLPGRFSCISP